MARISELHYSNTYANAANSNVPEFLEVALQPGEDPADFTVSFYQDDGTHGLDINLQDALDNGTVTVTTDPENGEIIYVLSSQDHPFLLTDPDGSGATNYEAYALTNVTTNTLIDFYDIGGGTQNIVAIGGAAGATGAPGTVVSVNIPTPTGPNTVFASIQFNQPNPDVAVFTAVSPGDSGPACFVAGTEIMTPFGPVAIDELGVGDLVLTRDHGPQVIRWCGQRRMDGTGRFAPIHISAGQYGATRDLCVSPQHRVLLTGWQAELLFGEPEILVPAKALINDKSVRSAPCARVTYYHLLFDMHQIVESHGFWSESYYPLANDCAGWSPETQEELGVIFPQLEQGKFGPLARPCVPVQLGKLLRQP